MSATRVSRSRFIVRAIVVRPCVITPPHPCHLLSPRLPTFTTRVGVPDRSLFIRERTNNERHVESALRDRERLDLSRSPRATLVLTFVYRDSDQAFPRDISYNVHSF